MSMLYMNFVIALSTDGRRHPLPLALQRLSHLTRLASSQPALGSVSLKQYINCFITAFICIKQSVHLLTCIADQSLSPATRFHQQVIQ